MLGRAYRQVNLLGGKVASSMLCKFLKGFFFPRAVQMMDDAGSADALLALMQDVDEEVRHWATFGLGVLGDLNSDEIRDALSQRTTDPDSDVREESLVGLAKRKDQRVTQLIGQ